MSAHDTVLPPGRRLIVTAVVMTATLMVVLDATIANVALPHMRASLQASPETISWVLTSYIVASAVATPLTGWLSDRIGRRELFVLALAGFTLSSMLCGVATSLEMMVASRVAQGLFGAFVAPMSQAILYDINPPEKHATAMTIWGAGVMVGPILGPLVGGALTEALNWRWVFFINAPFGIIAVVGSWLLLTNQDVRSSRFDLTGFGLLSVALCALQLMLDRGPQLDWFESTEIVVEAALTLAAFWMFAVHSVSAKAPIISLKLLANRSFVSGLVLNSVVGVIMMGVSALTAPMLQTLLGHSVHETGLLMAPRGIGSMLGMLVVGRLLDRIDPRALVGGGFLCVVWSLYLMSGFSIEMASQLVVVSGFLQGFGMGVALLPINLLGFSTLAVEQRTEGASMMTLMRSLGGSIGISVLTALLAHNLQVSHSDIAATMNAGALDGASGLAVGGASAATIVAYVDAEVTRQATMIAYIDNFWALMWLTVACLPLVLIIRRGKPQAGEAPMAME